MSNLVVTIFGSRAIVNVIMRSCVALVGVAAIYRVSQGSVDPSLFAKTASIATVEELVFRYWLQTKLAVALSETKAILLSSLLFALLHSGGYGFSAELIGIFLVSVALGALFAQMKSLLYPIALHICINVTMYGNAWALQKENCSAHGLLGANCESVAAALVIAVLGSSIMLVLARVLHVRMPNGSTVRTRVE